MTPWRRGLGFAVGAVLVLALVGCGNQVAEAEQSATAYFSAPQTGEWQAAIASSTGVAKVRAEYYTFLQTIPNLPPAAQFNADEEAAGASVKITELSESDGVISASGTLVGGPELANVEFADNGEGVQVADFTLGSNPDGSPLQMSDLWGVGESEVTTGGVTVRPIGGRVVRTSQTNEILFYEWAVSVANTNDWPITINSVTFTPVSGQPVVGDPNVGEKRVSETLLRAPTEIAPGRSAGVWVSEPARTPESSGTVSVSTFGASVTQVLTVELPVLVAPPGWNVR